MEKNECLRKMGLLNVKKLTYETEKDNNEKEREKALGDIPLNQEKELLEW